MATVRTPRQSWVDAGLLALATGGPDAVRIEALAASLGVTKGGFYWHFADRNSLLEAMLDSWERRSIDEVVEQVEREGGDSREKIVKAGRLTFSASRGLRQIDLAVRDWSRRDRSVAARLRRVDNARIAYLRSLFATFCADDDEIEARCMIAMCLPIGDHFIAADHDGRSRAEIMKVIIDQLLAPVPGSGSQRGPGRMHR